jgi:hypothetical protein
MGNGFLSRYLAAFEAIPGWFSPDAYLMFVAYHQLLAEAGIDGNVMEIGVHHGLSAIGLAALRGEGGRFVAVDLFEDLQAHNVSRSGSGSQARFLEHMGRFHGDLSFLTTIAARSDTLLPDGFGRTFTFCHLDGGHTAAEAYADLELAVAISEPGGLVAVDDYFNPAFPGVGEAAVSFALEQPDAVRPIAIGFNKVLLQRQPAPFDLNAQFAERFAQVCAGSATLWGVQVPLFNAGFSAFFDCGRSEPRRLAAADGNAVAARIESARQEVTVPAGGTVCVPVHVTNLSRLPLARGAAPFGLSYHLWAADPKLSRFDNPREWFDEPLLPGAARTIAVPVQAPAVPGAYEVEFDVVWEGVMWMKSRGNPTARITLEALAEGSPSGSPQEFV